MNIKRYAIGVITYIAVNFSVNATDITGVKVYFDSRANPKPQLLHSLSASQEIFDLGESEILQDQINRNLSKDPAEAELYMRKLMNDPKGKKKLQAIVNAGTHIGEAFILGVKKVPAIVINDSYVIYGTTNIAKAVAMFNKVAATSPNKQEGEQ